MTPFRWQNCHADVAAARHDRTIQAFLDDVILPAIQKVETRIAELGQSDEPAACFEQSDMQDLLAETKLAFCLAIQSVWERQLRAYLSSCGEELLPGKGVGARVEKANWLDLCAHFRELRCIRLEAFPSFNELDTLHHLGNACRHGDGTSAALLTQRCPDWWPVYSQRPTARTKWPTRQTVATMSVPVKRIEVFVTAIVRFWEDVSYIYHESIVQKHESLERRLSRERIERTWRPTAEEHGA
jgi:hypothetical protein